MAWNQTSNGPGVLPTNLHALGLAQDVAGGLGMGGADVAGGVPSASFAPGHGAMNAQLAAAAAANNSSSAINSHNHLQQPIGDMATLAHDGGSGQNASNAAAAAAAVAGADGSGSPGNEENGDGDSDDGGVNRDDAEGIWSPDIEQSFQEALAIYPPCGRRKIILSDEGKMYGRNELIARYIKLRTSKVRTRKQVSSHIQVLARKKSRELQTRLKEAQSDKEQGQLHNLIHSLPSMSSAQIVSTQFNNEQGDGGPAELCNVAAPGINHMSAMKPDGNHHVDVTAASMATNSHPHLMPRTVGASSAAVSTTGSNSIIVKNEPGGAGAAAVAVTAARLGNVGAALNAGTPVWPQLALHGFNDQMVYGGVPAAAAVCHGMVAATSPSFIMTSPPGPGMASHIPLVSARLAQPMLNHAVPAVANNMALNNMVANNMVASNMAASNMAANNMAASPFTLVSLTAFREDHRDKDSSDATASLRQHLFIHIPPNNNNFHSPSLESIEIKQIYDKFPGLRDLYDNGPQDVFFCVKFWADINVAVTDDAAPFYGVSTAFRSPEQVVCCCSTKVCSFGTQVVEKLETQHSTVENGMHVVRMHRSPMCEYMVKFVHKLVALQSRKQMNDVLENFTILQLVRSRESGQLLMCLAFVFEVSPSDKHGTYHNVYRLVNE